MGHLYFLIFPFIIYQTTLQSYIMFQACRCFEWEWLYCWYLYYVSVTLNIVRSSHILCQKAETWGWLIHCLTFNMHLVHTCTHTDQCPSPHCYTAAWPSPSPRPSQLFKLWRKKRTNKKMPQNSGMFAVLLSYKSLLCPSICSWLHRTCQ